MRTEDLVSIRERIQQLETELVRLKGLERIAALDVEARRLAASQAPAPRRESPVPVSKVKLALSMPEAAEAMSVSERTLWSMVQRGELPHVRLGDRRGRVLIPVAELTAWLSDKAKQAQADERFPEALQT